MNAASPDDIDISAIWRTVRRRLPVLLALSLGAGLVTFGILSMVTPRYTSEAQIQVVVPKPVGGSASGDSLATRMDKEAINTHVRALLSSDLASEVIAQEDLASKPEFNSALRPPTLVSRILSALGLSGSRSDKSVPDRVLEAYYERLVVYSPQESRIIAIMFTSSDPKLAADVANRLAGDYVASLATRTVSETGVLQEALEPKIAKLTKEVAAADAAVERFRGQANIFTGGPSNTGLNQQQLGELTAELTKAQTALDEAEARAESTRQMVSAGSAEALPDVQKSPLIQNLVQQRVRVDRQISELSATLLPGHPRMRQLRAELVGLKRQIKSEVANIVDGIEKGAKAAALRVDAVKRSLDAMKTRVVSTGGDEVKLRQLEAVGKSKRSELERLQAQFEANRARADRRSIPVEAQIITSARPSSVPSFPKKVPYSVLIALAVILFGIAIVVTRALFTAARGPASRQQEAWENANLPPVRGELQAAGSAAAGPAAYGSTDAVHTVDSVAALASQLLDCGPDVGGFRTLLTGETDALDAGGEAVELAKALAEAGSDVMLLDWSLDGNGIAETLGARSRPGMAELLQGHTRFEDVVRRMPGSNAHLIACGTPATNVDALLDPERINMALDALDTAYDHIVVVGSNRATRALFEAIQGRFDAGVIVADRLPRASQLPSPPGSFLGFDVTDIEIFRLERAGAGERAQERLARFTSKGGAEARYG